MSGSSQGNFSQLTKLPSATADSDAQVGLGIRSSFTKPPYPATSYTRVVVRHTEKNNDTYKMEEYLRKINSFIERLDDNTLSALKQISKTKTYKKGDFLLRQDEVCRHSFWIQKGIVRKFYLNDGKEITTELLFEDDIAVSFNSYILQITSKEFIQAITDTSVTLTNYTDFQNAKTDFPKLVELDFLITEFFAMWLEKRLFEFHTLDATRRYLLLVKEHPYIIQNVPLTFIASYLGISLETLSRIRAKI